MSVRPEDAETVPARPVPPVRAEEGPPFGEAIGRYLVLAVLGRGGMGVVYAAYDPVLDRRIALKLLREVASDGEGTEGRVRMSREAQALARLSHPNVMTVHDVGEHAGSMYIAMELVDGTTLGEWQPSQPWRAVVERYSDAARGLAAAHAAGIIHRDFKPDNVLVGKDGRVRVTDFGLARALEVTSSPPPLTLEESTTGRHALSDRLTALGTVMGTPRYMAPEQIDGEPVDARTDQFAWCLSLWEALYGEPPFAAVPLAARSAVMKTDIPVIPSKSPVPRAVGRVLLRGLARDPAKRWSDLDTVVAALARLTTRRRPALLITLALLAVAAAVIVVVTRQAAPVAGPSCDAAALPVASAWSPAAARQLTARFAASGAPFASDAATALARTLDGWRSRWQEMALDNCRATRVAGSQSERVLDVRSACLARRKDELAALLASLAQADAKRVEEAHSIELPDLESCADAAALAEAAPRPTDPAAMTELTAIEHALDALDGELAGSVSVERARQLEPLARDLASRATAAGWGPLGAQTRIALAGVQRQLGQGKQARNSLVTAAAAAAAAADGDGMVDAYTDLVEVETDLNSDFALGTSWAELAAGTLSRLGPRPSKRLRLALARGDNAYRAGDLQAARGDYEAALVRARARGPGTEVDVLGSLALVEMDLGNYDAATAHLTRAETLARAELGAAHPRLGGILQDRGVLAYNRGRYAEAEHHFRAALTLREAALGEDSPVVARSLQSLGVSLIRAGRLDDAAPMIERALHILEGRYGPQHPDVADALNDIGGVYHQAGEYQLELAASVRALAIREAALGPEHRDVAQSLVNIAIASKNLGQWDEVFESYERAIAIFTKVHGPNHFTTAIAHLNLAEARRVHGDDAAAAIEYERARPGFVAAVGEDHAMMGHVWNGTGQLAYARKDYPRAITHLERAVTLRETDPGDAPALAESRLALARALVARDRARSPRAEGLAIAARDGYRAAGTTFAAKVTEIEQWLAPSGR